MPTEPASPRAVPPVDSRANYPHLTTIATRWMDNDIYGHLNNVVHYSLFDTAVNGWLVEKGLLDPHRDPIIFRAAGGASYELIGVNVNA